MRRASWMSLGMIASAASWSARTAWLWNLRSVLKSCAISLTSLWNGSFLIRSSVLFWYLRISLPQSENKWHQHLPYIHSEFQERFFTPPVVGADFLAASVLRVAKLTFVASCFLGALPPVDLRAVCFVRAMPRRLQEAVGEVSDLGDEDEGMKKVNGYSRATGGGRRKRCQGAFTLN
ncbi:unnamed protein product [Spirodela intermedia]|uniref:Uncharacterized protein n=1 Tax=Spirodela intermedia TaxID=51605 RepID=A0A7I8J027_SPIIN|nr:unnamed protein product [Spirodela intermedia]CAA6663183.1 unnamed protein product [Spirodela intermedia]